MTILLIVIASEMLSTDQLHFGLGNDRHEFHHHLCHEMYLGSGNLRHIHHAGALVKLWPLFKGDCHRHHHRHCHCHHNHHHNHHHLYLFIILRSLQSMCRSCCRKMRFKKEKKKIISRYLAIFVSQNILTCQHF